MTFSFSEILAAAPIESALASADGGQAIRQVTALLNGHPAVTDADRITTLVLEREKLSPTAMGHGVAFPHARTDTVREIVMAIGRSPAGVPFDGADDPVHFLFVIATPPDRVPQYLAVVGRLARTLKNAAVREQLFQAATAEELRAILQAG